MHVLYALHWKMKQMVWQFRQSGDDSLCHSLLSTQAATLAAFTHLESLTRGWRGCCRMLRRGGGGGCHKG